MNEYQKQSVLGLTPLQLVVRLYDLAIAACRSGDRKRLRAAVAELMSALDMENGGEISPRLFELYEYCINESVSGDLDAIAELLLSLREAWAELAGRKAA